MNPPHNYQSIKKSKEGFTLIEMLVVVAVIGLLSSVILVALGPAKEKAKDSRIIQEVNQVRSLAETMYDGSYRILPQLPSVIEIGNKNLKELADDIALQGGALTIINPAPFKGYSAYSKLNTKLGDAANPVIQYYCIDSVGHSVNTTIEPSTPTCPVQ
ncbi:MAG: type II secretion system protein [Patescibacteria group bacterium]